MIVKVNRKEKKMNKFIGKVMKYGLGVVAFVSLASVVKAADDTNITAFADAATAAIDTTKSKVVSILLTLFGLAVVYFIYRKIRSAMGK